MLSYRKRDYWEEREDTEWRIEPEALVRIDANGRRSEWRWRDVVGVRIDLKRRQQRWRNTLSIWLEGESESRCEVDNLSVVTVGEYERKDDYRSFALAVLTNVVANAPRARAGVGMKKGEYRWWVLLLLGLMLALPFELLDPSAPIARKLMLTGAVLLLGYVLVRDRPKVINVSALEDRLQR